MASNFKNFNSLSNNSLSSGNSLDKAANMYGASSATQQNTNPYSGIKLPTVKQPKAPSAKELAQQRMNQQMAFAGQFSLDAVSNLINDTSFANGTADQRKKLFENYANKTIPDYLDTHPLTQGDPMFKASVQAQAQQALQSALEEANQGIGGTSIMTGLKVGLNLTKNMAEQLYYYYKAYINQPEYIEQQYQERLANLNEGFKPGLDAAKMALDSTYEPLSRQKAQAEYDYLKAQYDKYLAQLESVTQANRANAHKYEAESLASIIRSARDQAEFQQQMMKEDPNWADIQKQRELNMNDPNSGFTKNFAGMFGARGGDIATDYIATTTPTMASILPFAVGGIPGLAAGAGLEVQGEVINQVAQEIAEAPISELMTVPEFSAALKKYKDMGVSDPEASARGYLVRKLLQDNNSLVKAFAVGAVGTAVAPEALFVKGSLINRLLTSKIISNNLGGKIARVLGGTAVTSVSEGVEEVAGNAVANQAVGKPLTENWQEQFFPAMVASGPMSVAGGTSTILRETYGQGNEQSSTAQTTDAQSGQRPTEPNGPVTQTEPTDPTDPTDPTSAAESTESAPPTSSDTTSETAIGNPFYQPVGNENTVTNAGEVAANLRDKVEALRGKLRKEGKPVIISNLNAEEISSLVDDIRTINASGIANAEGLVNDMLNSFTSEKKRNSGKLSKGDVSLSVKELTDAYAANVLKQYDGVTTQQTPTVSQPTEGQVTEEPNKPAPVTDTAATTEAGTDLQTRGSDRSSPVSIAQMQSIAANPVPDRLLSNSIEAQSGAPVVTDTKTQIAPGQKGNATTVQSGQTVDGRFVSTNAQWAVVPVSSLLTSHNAEGIVNTNYNTNPEGMIRVVSGNGRSAGLARAYSNARAGDYKQALAERAQQFGISPDVVKSISDPVLVRVISDKDATPEFVRNANETQMLGASSFNQAMLDATAVDKNGDPAIPMGYATDKYGNPTDDTLINFLNVAIPANEHLGYVDSDGKPNGRLRDRFNAAVFQAAYGDQSLFNTIYESEQEGMRNIATALKKAAGGILLLSKAGRYDLRQYIIDAALRVVDGKSKGMTINEIASLTDLLSDDQTYDYSVRAVIQMFRDNSRSSDAIANVLIDFASRAYSAFTYESESAHGGDLFVVDAPSPQSIFNSVFNVSENIGDQNNDGRGVQRTDTADSGTANTQQTNTTEAGQQDATQSATSSTATESTGTSGATREVTSETPDNVPSSESAQDTGDRTNSGSSDTVTSSTAEGSDTGSGSTTSQTEQRSGSDTGTEGNDVAQGQQTPVIAGNLTQSQYRALDEKLSSEGNIEGLQDLAKQALTLAQTLVPSNGTDNSETKAAASIILKTVTALARATDRAVSTVFEELVGVKLFTDTRAEKLGKGKEGTTHYIPRRNSMYVVLNADSKTFISTFSHEMAHVYINAFTSWVYRTIGEERTTQQQKAIKDFATVIRTCFSRNYKFLNLPDETLIYQFSTDAQLNSSNNLDDSIIVSSNAHDMLHEFIANGAEFGLAHGNYNNTPFAKLYKEDNAFVKGLARSLQYFANLLGLLAKRLGLDTEELGKRVKLKEPMLKTNRDYNLYVRPVSNYLVNGIPEPILNFLKDIYNEVAPSITGTKITDNTVIDSAVIDRMISRLVDAKELNAQILSDALSNAIEDVRRDILNVTDKQQSPVPTEQATTPTKPRRKKSSKAPTKEAPVTDWSIGKDVSWLTAVPTTPEEQNIARMIIRLDGKYESGASHQALAKLVKNALDNGAEPYHLRNMVQQLSDMYDQTGDAYIYLSELPEVTAPVEATDTVAVEPTSDTAESNTALVQNLPTMLANVVDGVPMEQALSKIDRRMFGNQFLNDNLPMEFPLVSNIIDISPVESDVGLSAADALSNYVTTAVAEEFLMLQEMYAGVMSSAEILSVAKDTVRKRVTASLGNAIESNEILLNEQKDLVAKMLSERPEVLESVDPANPVNPILNVEGLSDEDAVAIASGGTTVRNIMASRPDRASTDTTEGTVGSAYGTLTPEADAELAEIIQNDIILEINDGANNSQYLNMTDTPAYQKFIKENSERIVRNPLFTYDVSTAASIGDIAGRKLGIGALSDTLTSIMRRVGGNVKSLESIYKYNPKAKIDTIRYYVNAEVLSGLAMDRPLVTEISRGTAPKGSYADALGTRIRTGKMLETLSGNRVSARLSEVGSTMLHEIQHSVVSALCNYFTSAPTERINPVAEKLRDSFVAFAHDVGIPDGHEFSLNAWDTMNYSKSVAEGKIVPNEVSSVAAEAYLAREGKPKEANTSVGKLLNFLSSVAGIVKNSDRPDTLTDRLERAARWYRLPGLKNVATYEAPRRVFAKEGLSDAILDFMDTIYNQNVVGDGLTNLIADAGQRKSVANVITYMALAHQISNAVLRLHASSPNMSIQQALDKVNSVIKETLAEVSRSSNAFTSSNNFLMMYRNGTEINRYAIGDRPNIPTYVKLPENYLEVETTNGFEKYNFKGVGSIESIAQNADIKENFSTYIESNTSSKEHTDAAKFLRSKGIDAIVHSTNGEINRVSMLNNPEDISFDLFYQNDNSTDEITHERIVDIDALANEPATQQAVIKDAARIVAEIHAKNQEAAQQYISDFSAAESTFEAQGLMEPMTPNWWSKFCVGTRELLVDENAPIHGWTSLNLPTHAGGPGTSSMNMEFTLTRNRVLAARDELAEQCMAPLNDYLKDVAARLNIDVATVAKDLGTMYTDLHTLEAQRKQEVELEQALLRAQLMPTGVDKDEALAMAQTDYRAFKVRQSGEDNGFKLYGGKPAKDCMEELTNLSQTYESVADEAMVQFRDAFQKVVNIMLSRGVLSDEYRSYFGDFMYYMPLYTKTQYEDAKINDVVALFSPKQDRSRHGSTSFALDAYTNLNWLIGRTANNLGSKQLGEEIVRSYEALGERYKNDAPSGESKVNAIKSRIGRLEIIGYNGLYVADADYINAVSLGRERVPEAQQRKAQSIRDHAAIMVRRVVPVVVNGENTSISKNFYVWFNEHEEDYVDNLFFDKQGNQVTEDAYNSMLEHGAKVTVTNHVDSNAKVHRALYEPFHLDNEKETTTQKALNLMRKATSGFGQLFTTYTAFFPIINAERDFVERATFANGKTYRDENGNAIPGSLIAMRMSKNGMSFIQSMTAAYTGKPEDIGGIDGQYLTEMKQLGVMNSASISRMLDHNGSKLRAVIEQNLPLMTDANERALIAKQLAGLPKKALRVWAEMLYSVPAYAMFKSLRESGVTARDSAYYVTEMMNLNMKSSLGRGLSYIFPFVSSIGNTALQLVNSMGFNLYTFGTNKAKRVENAKNTARTGLLMAVGIAGISASIPLIAIGLGDGDIDKGYRILDQKPLGSYNYIPIPIGGGRSVKLPLGFGLGPLMAQFAFGINRMMRNRTTVGAMFWDMMDSLIRNNSPLTAPNYDTKDVQGWAGKVLYTITPSLLQPFAALAMNKDYWGSPINRNKFTDATQRASDTGSLSTADGWKSAVKWLYDKTGIDMNPESLRFLTKSYCAGPLSFITEYVDSKRVVTDPQYPSTRASLGPGLATLGAASLYDDAGNVDQQAYFSAVDFYNDLIRQAGVYDVIKGKGMENNGPEHRRNMMLQMGFSPLVANDVALLKIMDSDLTKLYNSFKTQLNDAYQRKASIEEVKAINAAYYAQRNAYMHNALTQLNYYNNRIDKEADNLPPKEILNIYRSAYGNN